MVVAPSASSGEPTVWAKRQIDSLRKLGVVAEIYIFKDRRSLPGLVRGGMALRQKAREFEADLVHVHFGAAQAVVGVLFSGKPVIISFCGSDLLGNYDARGRKTWSGWLSGLLSRMGAIGCRRAIAKSEELRQALWVPSLRNKCDVIPNGIDLELFQPMPQSEARTSLGWDHQDPVVLFMDRKGAWVKDPALAHAAYNEAKKTVGNLRMYVFEHESPDKMPLLYNAADALLLTSRHEGSNNTIKEALACNLPIVATACGDIRERLQGVYGCYVCSRDHHELGDWLSLMVATRERSRGRQHVQELTLERVGMRIKQVYEKALSGCRKPECVTVRCE
ncbi:MAG: glycosyltransferase family 4 protein [Nitrospiraceae bacterium]